MNYIKKIATNYNIIPTKKLGQNFLTDESVMANIVSMANVSEAAVLEIGPGIGNMTRELLKARAKKVIAVEFDKNCIASLKLLKNQYPNLKIINADALKINEEELFESNEKIKVVANLPYNIGTALLIKWLKKINLFSSFTLMLQKEVVDRIVANRSTSDYGSLSVICQWLCYTEKLFNVPVEAFWPAPKVTSSVVNLIPHNQPLYDCTLEKLKPFLKMAFAQKRKMLRNNSKLAFREEVNKVFEEYGILPTSRAEELSIDQFCKLANLLWK
ncbi:MAG: 16S rRNA (adenine(1518)-N(6)/adenine(1519)-N(6))-dimethyltransferase RsmA [Candidatus Midichloria sp.]|nr:MAG: 16S rRNA (adenine(1518)-N(6)/adenine(1519)-N(6))-dimethyltransferase RsmA [Candidatus Midichloria sp.]